MSLDIKALISLINLFRKPMERIGKRIEQSIDKFYDKGIVPYLERAFEENYKTKTFIHRERDVEFYDIYYNLYLYDLNKQKIETSSVEQLFNKFQKIVFVGTAGSGKSLLAKHIFLGSIKEKLGIPILLKLRDLNYGSDDFENFVHVKIFNYPLYREKYSKKIKQNYIFLKNGDKVLEEAEPRNKKFFFEEALNDGKFIFIFDGYDEIFSNKKHNITYQIKSFVEKYRKNKFIITSRPGSGVESLHGFENLNLKPLNIDEIYEFIQLQFKFNEPLSNQIIEIIDSPRNRDYKSLLGNPLLLSMFLMTYTTHPELPKNKSQFYWNVFDTLFHKHDTFTKEGGFTHEKKSKLEKIDYEEFLQWFSLISFFDGNYSFSDLYIENKIKEIKKDLNIIVSIQDLIYDLQVAISILIRDGLVFIFPHRSIQEYFAAKCISELEFEKKKLIYDKEFLKLADSANELSNFWNLCLEMDKEVFLKYFVIERLSETLSLFSNESSSYHIVEKTLKHFKISHTLRKFYGQNNYAWEPVEIEDSIQTKLLTLVWPNWWTFFEINNLDIRNGALTWNAFETKGQFDLNVGIQYYRLNYRSNYDKQIFNLLKKVGLVRQVENFIKQFHQKIAELNEMVSNRTIKETNLLKLLNNKSENSK